MTVWKSGGKHLSPCPVSDIRQYIFKNNIVWKFIGVARHRQAATDQAHFFT